MSAEYEAAWYWCDIIDRFELAETPEPDWSKVPEDKRERVRATWLKGQEERLRPTTSQLWGPQIPWYQRQSQYDITVKGLAVGGQP